MAVTKCRKKVFQFFENGCYCGQVSVLLSVIGARRATWGYRGFAPNLKIENGAL